jgi:uncharacterized protein
VLFGSDSPYDPGKGAGYIRSAIADMKRLELTGEQRADIYRGNARGLFGPRHSAIVSPCHGWR